MANAYRFRGARGVVAWPTANGSGLGATGAFNFLLRIGLVPRLSENDFPYAIGSGDVLFASLDGPIPEQSHREALRNAVFGGAKIVGSGDPLAWRTVFPELFIGEPDRCGNPHAGLGYRFPGEVPQVMAPPQWDFFRFNQAPGASSSVQAKGQLVAIHGERQTPGRAIVSVLDDAPVLLRHGNFVYLNGNPFAALQAWLQGQEDLLPWLQWRHRLFWMDEFAADLFRLLRVHEIFPRDFQPSPIGGLPETTIVLRHDLDHSRDTAYLDLEMQEKVPAIHAVLRDANTDYWLRVLAKAPDHETAFHYNTGRYSRVLEAIRARLGLYRRSYRPARCDVAGDGLLRQVRWAKARGIGVATLHRHLSYIFYPEWIDAMHRVFEAEPEVLGGSSLFRGQVLRWGSDRLDGAVSTCGVFPDSQFPYWFPFKLAHAGLDGAPLRGWETTSVMEIEPEFFQQMLDHKVPGLLQRVFTINYHPVHAKRPTFSAGGSLPWFKAILLIIRERQLPVRTLRDVYASLNASTGA